MQSQNQDIILTQLNEFVNRVKAELDGSEQPEEDLMKLIDKYAKLKSNKKAAVDTIKNLVKFSKDKASCFLCKQALNDA